MLLQASLAIVVLYLLLAYLIAPEIWILRDEGRISKFDSMVTRADIPGDPINVGLVGSK
jgi:hypothetical protein